jgi:hypothetical protein
VALDSTAPTAAAVIAASGGHPGNPWREQRLLSLYQAAGGLEAEPAVETALVPAAAAA